MALSGSSDEFMGRKQLAQMRTRGRVAKAAPEFNTLYEQNLCTRPTRDCRFDRLS